MATSSSWKRGTVVELWVPIGPAQWLIVWIQASAGLEDSAGNYTRCGNY